MLEREHELRVSERLGEMNVLFVNVPDDPGQDSARGVIERNSIALLSSYREPSPDQPSSGWLGRYSGRERVRRSGLWNNNHVDENYDREFLSLFEELVLGTPIA